MIYAGVVSEALPSWTLFPFVGLVLSMASLPLLLPHLWEKRLFQAAVVAVCTLPIAALLLQRGLSHELQHCLLGYGTFICTLGALYVAAGGVFASADLRATPGVNVGFLLVGSLLASIIGTTGASVLAIRPLLRTNRQRRHTGHLVPFFILAVANAGGLLTPLGDPPLLVGFVSGVPFFWTLKLFPIWLLYNALFAGLLYLVDRRAYARESPEALRRDAHEAQPLSVRGKRNLALLACIVVAAFLPVGFRELALVAIGLGSYFGTPKEVHELNQFSFGPIAEVALLFVGLFVCLVPIELMMGRIAPSLPVRESYQLFWGSGLLSGVLDNAPTYAAFSALAKGLSAGQPNLVNGITELKLMAVSAGSVVMGATTYIGNGPNLMVKSIAERSGLVMPSFVRYAVFAFFTMLPAHLLVTLAFIVLER
ncbi:MAG: sodium:proton antiporter [Myxococcales bacterium]|nr:MAG: sodium:proton antiporter [Myxococcales bacterium]